jgi:hypothetical protein
MTAAGEAWSTYDTLLRLDFVNFAQRAFRELSPRGAFLMSWHIETVGAKLTPLRRGKLRRVIINMPPRHLKSHLASVALPAGCLEHETMRATSLPRRGGQVYIQPVCCAGQERIKSWSAN